MRISPAQARLATYSMNNYSGMQKSNIKSNAVSFGNNNNDGYTKWEEWGCSDFLIYAAVAAALIYAKSCMSMSEYEQKNEDAKVAARVELAQDLNKMSYSHPESDGGVDIVKSEIEQREKIIDMYENITTDFDYYCSPDRKVLDSNRDDVLKQITDAESDDGVNMTDKEIERLRKELQIAVDDLTKKQ